MLTGHCVECFSDIGLTAFAYKAFIPISLYEILLCLEDLTISEIYIVLIDMVLKVAAFGLLSIRRMALVPYTPLD